MTQIKRILVPTDFSEPASTAYSYAREIATLFNARIDCIHIVPMMQYFNFSMQSIGAPLDMEKDVYPHIIEENESQLQDIMEEQFPDDIRGTYHVQVGRKPSDSIVNYARQHGYDMIVMGTQGHHKTEILRGSITEKVIRHATVPVLTVPQPLADGKHVNHIMMPTDTSRVSLISLPLTVILANRFEADITLFHVIELYGTISENVPHDPDVTEVKAIYDHLMETVYRYLPSHSKDTMELERGSEDYVDTIVYRPEAGEEKRIKLVTELVKGVSAHYDIEDYATNKMDLVVMTTHGRSGLAHLLLGSTTEQVARHVNMPVLTIRPEKHQIEQEEGV